MNRVLGGAAALLAAALVTASYLLPGGILLPSLIALVVVVSIGWPKLLDRPLSAHTIGVPLGAGTAALVAQHLETGYQTLPWSPLVIAASLVVSFAYLLANPAARVGIVATIVTVAAGVVVTTSASGWLGLMSRSDGKAIGIVAGAATAGAVAVAAIPGPRLAIAPLTMATGIGVGYLASGLDRIPLNGIAGIAFGAAAGIAVAGINTVVHRMTTDSIAARIAGACAAVALAGTFAIVTTEILSHQVTQTPTVAEASETITAHTANATHHTEVPTP